MLTLAIVLYLTFGAGIVVGGYAEGLVRDNNLFARNQSAVGFVVQTLAGWLLWPLFLGFLVVKRLQDGHWRV